MGMFNLVEKSMNHRRRDELTFETKSSGVGDSSFGGLYKFLDTGNQQAHLGLMALLPTADIDEKDATPLSNNAQLPYPMQLGAGSWGVAPSITWVGHSDDWSWGSQASGKIYLADNENDYRLGNRVEGTTWGAFRWSDWLSTSLRVNVSHWGNITGRDEDIATTPPMGMLAGQPLIPTSDPKLRGGTRIDLSVGANILIPGTGLRFAVEGGAPVYQDLDRPQLGTEWFVTGGIQYAF
jgi:hypothetical protein